jgi:hypothetical protein
MEASIGGVAGEGFVEPSTGRYQICEGGYATVVTGGRQWFGGEDIVRDTPCQVIAVETNSRQFVFWMDDAYMRRVRE